MGREDIVAEQRPVALVTGANRGIGLAIARGLAERGILAILGARDGAAAAEAAATMSGIGRHLDVTDQGSVDQLLGYIRGEYGRLDILVNNAAVLLDTDDAASGTSLDAVERTLCTNLIGPWRLCQAALPLMRGAGHGRVVNLSSGAGSFGETGGAYAPAYSVSKAALNMLTVQLAAELRGTDILINAACPGWVRTEMGGPGAPRAVEQGAETPIWLATLPKGGPTGSFFRDRAAIPW